MRFPRPTAIHVTCLGLLASCGGASSEGEFGASLAFQPERSTLEDGTSFPGFTLIAPLSSKRVHLIDMEGNEVHHWDTREKAGESNYLTERGTLLRCREVPNHPTFQDSGGHGGGIFEYDAQGNVLWEFLWDNDAGLQHHDIEELPNGNVLFTAWDRGTREEALAAGRDPALLEGQEWWSGAVYEVRPDRPKGGEIVWSWHAKDHLIQDFDRGLEFYGDPSVHPEKIDINGDRDPEPPSRKEASEIAAQMKAAGYAGDGGGDEPAPAETEKEPEPDGQAKEADDEEEPEVSAEEKARKARVKNADWMHTNAVDYNAELDQIVISVRRFDEVWIIDHGVSREEAKGAQGDLLYRFGNAYAYGLGQWRERRFLGQHNVQWIGDGLIGEGNLIVFNNGASPRRWSSIVEIWPPRDTEGHYPRMEGQPFGPSQYEWSYHADEVKSFYAPFISGVQRLPGGSTLICSGPDGLVFEVNQAGDTVWEWQNDFEPFGVDPKDDEAAELPVALFRATRYGPNSAAIVALREAGAPIPESPGEAPAISTDDE